MDSDDLVRRVTAEVMRRLAPDGGAAPPPGAGGAGRQAAAGGGAAAGARGRRALCLLTGADRRTGDVLRQLGRIASASGAVTVALSPSAGRIIGVPAVRRAAPGAAIVTEGDTGALLHGADAIYIPALSLTAAGKIAALLPDSFVCILAVNGLVRGIPVIAARDTLLPAAADPAAVPPAVRQKIDGLLAELARLGVTLVPLDEIGGAAGEAAPAKAPARPAPGSPCVAHAGGECSACGACVEKRAEEVKHIVSAGADRVAAAAGARPAHQDLARMIDHTLLKPDATEAQVRALCEEARAHRFASVCVNPSWVALCAGLLAGSDVKVCTVIGFPLGATTPTAKAIETRDAVANGATEIDMVINVGALKSGNDALVRHDIESVVDAAKGRGIVKVILETALLAREEIVKACLLAKMAGADFVKTSTGFAPGGATVEHIALMRATVGPEMGVKASGGIRDRETAEAMVAAGATRIGASASVAIATGKKTDTKGY